MTSVTNSCGTTTYSWDARNRLVGIDGYKPDCTLLNTSFKYDALGRRIEKTINGRAIQYLNSGLDIVQEMENGVVSVNYIRTLNIDEPLVRIKADGTVRYYQTDALGSVIALTDETGAIKTQYTYDPYGNVTVSGEASDNPFQYTGRENDGTGLYYYRFRYYSPELQRFISEDPLSLSQVLLLRQISTTSDNANLIYRFALMNPLVLNKYPYTINNPLIYTDPYGLINWGKVGTGIFFQFVGYGVTGLGYVVMSATVAAEIETGLVGVLVSIAHNVEAFGLGGSIMSTGGFIWKTGTEQIYEGFAELDELENKGVCKLK